LVIKEIHRIKEEIWRFLFREGEGGKEQTQAE